MKWKVTRTYLFDDDDLENETDASQQVDTEPDNYDNENVEEIE